jgi:hypothetical protein
MIILPRPALDKHRESTQKKSTVVSQAAAWCMPGRLGGNHAADQLHAARGALRAMAELRVNIHSLVLNGPHIGGSVKAAKKLMARTLKVKESEAKEAMTYEGSYSGTPEQKVLAWCGARKTLAVRRVYTTNDHFAKTGSGPQRGNAGNRGVVFAGSRRCLAGRCGTRGSTCRTRWRRTCTRVLHCASWTCPTNYSPTSGMAAARLPRVCHVSATWLPIRSIDRFIAWMRACSRKSSRKSSRKFSRVGLSVHSAGVSWPTLCGR